MNIRIVWNVEDHRGDMGPRGYGLAYRRYDLDQVILYPIPLNLVVRLFCETVWAMQWGIRPTRREVETGQARDAGFQSGLEIGRKQGIEKTMNHIRILEIHMRFH